ncbi:MAG: hypothetical protein HGA47_11445 [Zoogloea sp.]|nr:hypothetical protein [Zoogloea sp.]
MVIFMDMENGKVVAEPPQYDEEVLNANCCLPPEVALGLQAVQVERPARTAVQPPADVEQFLQAVYRYQE